eukprot:3289931-Rhodomonas_salina.1
MSSSPIPFVQSQTWAQDLGGTCEQISAVVDLEEVDKLSGILILLSLLIRPCPTCFLQLLSLYDLDFVLVQHA